MTCMPAAGTSGEMRCENHGAREICHLMSTSKSVNADSSLRMLPY